MLFAWSLSNTPSATAVESFNARSETAIPDENFVATKRVAKSNKVGFDFYSEGDYWWQNPEREILNWKEKIANN